MNTKGRAVLLSAIKHRFICMQTALLSLFEQNKKAQLKTASKNVKVNSIALKLDSRPND